VCYNTVADNTDLIRTMKREGKVGLHKVARCYICVADIPGPIPIKFGVRVAPYNVIKSPIFVVKFSGVSDPQVTKFPVSHWPCWSSLQQCCATAQPVIIIELVQDMGRRITVIIQDSRETIFLFHYCPW